MKKRTARRKRSGLSPEWVWGGGAIIAGLMIAIGVVAWTMGRNKSAPNVQNQTSSSSPSDIKPAEQAWRSADFVMVNPTDFAVAFRRNRSGTGYEVTGKSAGADVRTAKRNAWEAGTPIIANYPDLARRAFNRFEVGESLDSETTAMLDRETRFTPLLPEQSRLIKFHDLTANASRVGHALGSDRDRFDFIELLPSRRAGLNPNAAAFRSEVIVRSDRVRPGTEVLDLNDKMLFDSVDTLDYFVYHVVEKLNDEGLNGGQRRSFLFVDGAFADLQGWGGVYLGGYGQGVDNVDASRQRRVQDAQKQVESKPFASKTEAGLQLLSILLSRVTTEMQSAGDPVRKKQLEAEARELEWQITFGKKLLEEENRITGLIRSRLVASGVAVVDRSERAKSIYLNQISLQDWLRNHYDRSTGFAGQKDTEAIYNKNSRFDSAEDDGATHATHILLTDIRRPDDESKGRYQLHMRLIRVRDLNLLWEELRDRPGSNMMPPRQNGTASLAAAPAVAITGVWQSGNLRFNVREDNTGLVTLRYGDPGTSDKLLLKGQRERNIIRVSSCQLTIRAGTKSVSQDVNAHCYVRSDGTIMLQHQTLKVDPRGSVTTGEYARAILTRVP